jgi:hypothetical protein
VSDALEPQTRPNSADPSEEGPAVLSPGDSDAPDAPDPATIYPDKQGVPGGTDNE